MICCFPLLLLISSLSLIFVNLIMCLDMFLLGFILYRTLHFLVLNECFLSHVSEVLGYYFIKYFLRPFLSFSGTTVMPLVCLMLSQRSPRLTSSLFILISLFCSVAVIFTILASSTLICSSTSFILLFIPSSVFSLQLCIVLRYAF